MGQKNVRGVVRWNVGGGMKNSLMDEIHCGF
jgi:hypothetical protein